MKPTDEELAEIEKYTLGKFPRPHELEADPEGTFDPPPPPSKEDALLIDKFLHWKG